MDDWLLFLLAGLIGAGTGFLSGMLGIGGGSIRVPLLNLIGFSLIETFAINLFVIPFSSLFGAASHYENLDLKLTLTLVIGGCSGTALGIFIAVKLSISSLVLPIIFLITSFITVLGLNLYKLTPNFSSKLRPTIFNIVLGGFILNLITGLKGGSGGSLFPPFMRTLNVDMHKAIAVSLLTTFFTSLIGILMIYSFQGFTYGSESFLVAISSIIGVKLGSIISLKSKPRFLEILLSIMVVILATIPLIKALL
jgi:uncharacterized membrane protein YfcA